MEVFVLVKLCDSSNTVNMNYMAQLIVWHNTLNYFCICYGGEEVVRVVVGWWLGGRFGVRW